MVTFVAISLDKKTRGDTAVIFIGSEVDALRVGRLFARKKVIDRLACQIVQAGAEVEKIRRHCALLDAAHVSMGSRHIVSPVAWMLYYIC